MEPTELSELHYITHIKNIPSILNHGILSNKQAIKHHPVSVAMSEVQARRSDRSVPQGQPIHNYACLYLHARNPMLYKILNSHEELTVLQVSVDAFNIPGGIIADGNASSDYTRFYPSSNGLQNLDSSLVLARYWTSQDPYEYMYRKRVRCAELLIPERVPPELILGAYVSCLKAQASMVGAGFGLPIVIDHDFFFNTGV